MPLARSLDLRSTLLGLGLAGSLFCLTALAATPTPPLKTVRLSFDPDPTSIVRVDEGESFTVPAKLLFVIKAVGLDPMAWVEVKVNGDLVFTASSSDNSGMLNLGFPLVAKAGDVVSLETSFPDPQRPSFLTGYLSE